MDVRDKIAKLLALADSPNEHEALLALTKARELMVRHSLREGDIPAMGGLTVVRAPTKLTYTQVTNPWVSSLASVVARRYCCKAYRSRKHRSRTLEIGLVGLSEDCEQAVAVAEGAYAFAAARCRSIRSRYRQVYETPYLRQLADAYGNGFVSGLREAYFGHETMAESQDLAPAPAQQVWDAIKELATAPEEAPPDYSGDRMRFARAGYLDGKSFTHGNRLSQKAQSFGEK